LGYCSNKIGHSNDVKDKICNCCGSVYQDIEILFDENITSNLTVMAHEADIYKLIWEPEASKAKELIKPLTEAINRLKYDSEYYKRFNPKNGWGDYEGFLSFLDKYSKACKLYPDSTIIISK